MPRMPDTASARRDIWFRGNATAQNGAKTASITIPRPTGTQAGDLIVTIIDVRGAATVTPPAGWTLAQENTSGNAVRQVTYYRIASASEPASTIWGLSSKQGASAVSAAYGGVHTEQPLDVSGGQSAVQLDADHRAVGDDHHGRSAAHRRLRHREQSDDRRSAGDGRPRLRQHEQRPEQGRDAAE